MPVALPAWFALDQSTTTVRRRRRFESPPDDAPQPAGVPDCRLDSLFPSHLAAPLSKASPFVLIFPPEDSFWNLRRY
jgi:hypothetical protein